MRPGTPSRPSLRPTITKIDPDQREEQEPAAGLIYDDAGNRLVSSHATKNGKRYRYYVTTQGAGRTAATPGSARLWLPATVIDELVRTKLQNFLTDKTQISLLLREARCRPAQIGSRP